MIEQHAYTTRCWVLLLKGFAAACVYWGAFLCLLAAFVHCIGFDKLLVMVCAVEGVFYVFFLWRSAHLGAQPLRHEPEAHDSSASFKRFKALIMTEHAQGRGSRTQVRSPTCPPPSTDQAFAEYFSLWFLGAPFDSIKRQNVRELLAYGFHYSSV
ncbi:MAG: hypothetical protein WDW38_006123 [Sanguina aurantia]